MNGSPFDGTSVSIIGTLMNDHQIAVELLSLYYPFSAAEIDQYWDVLVHGDAHYSVFLDDTDAIYSPRFGLCFNGHIEWSASLRSRWLCGFDDPFHGYVVGAGSPCEFGERHARSMIIPLSVTGELEARSCCERRQMYAFGYDVGECAPPPSTVLAAEVLKRYPRLDCVQFTSLCESKRDVVLLNPSIWVNTVAPEIAKCDLVALLRGRGVATQAIQVQGNEGGEVCDGKI